MPNEFRSRIITSYQQNLRGTIINITRDSTELPQLQIESECKTQQMNITKQKMKKEDNKLVLTCGKNQVYY